jgi:hypothetical protein
MVAQFGPSFEGSLDRLQGFFGFGVRFVVCDDGLEVYVVQPRHSE